MAINVRLASGVCPSSDAVIFTNLVNTVTRINTITLAQPSTALTTTVLIGIGTTATPANVRLLQTLTTGSAQTYILAPALVLTGTDTLNIVAGTAAQTNYSVNGIRDIV